MKTNLNCSALKRNRDSFGRRSVGSSVRGRNERTVLRTGHVAFKYVCLVRDDDDDDDDDDTLGDVAPRIERERLGDAFSTGGTR